MALNHQNCYCQNPDILEDLIKQRLTISPKKASKGSDFEWLRLWQADSTVNPETGRTIKVDGDTYQKCAKKATSFSRDPDFMRKYREWQITTISANRDTAFAYAFAKCKGDCLAITTRAQLHAPILKSFDVRDVRAIIYDYLSSDEQSDLVDEFPHQRSIPTIC